MWPSSVELKKKTLSYCSDRCFGRLFGEKCALLCTSVFIALEYTCGNSLCTFLILGEGKKITFSFLYKLFTTNCLSALIWNGSTCLMGSQKSIGWGLIWHAIMLDWQHVLVHTRIIPHDWKLTNRTCCWVTFSIDSYCPQVSLQNYFELITLQAQMSLRDTVFGTETYQRATSLFFPLHVCLQENGIFLRMWLRWLM